jgi:outer membrane protein OmpA-like peptidoglycan-associated protein
MRRIQAALALSLLATGCMSSPYLQPMEAHVSRPEAGEIVAVESTILVYDASGSIGRTTSFPAEKAALESFIAGMPPGTYDASLRVLGGRPDDQLRLSRFDRFRLARHALEISWTGRETPLAQVLEESLEALGGRDGRVAFVIFTDGVATRHGKYIGPDETLESGRRLVGQYRGEVCLHTIQVGEDPRGQAIMEPLAALTPCGSFRRLTGLETPEALLAFQRAVYIGPAPPPEARNRRITDLDQDGVDDRFDRCAKTPVGARVDRRGCWVIEDYVFDSNGATIRPDHQGALDEIVIVMQQNPSLQIRLDGHTDDTGTAEYNFDLADRRAEAVRKYLTLHGIDPSRLQVRGFGSTRPIAPNDTPEGRRQNRRVELSVTDF